MAHPVGKFRKTTAQMARSVSGDQPPLTPNASVTCYSSTGLDSRNHTSSSLAQVPHATPSCDLRTAMLRIAALLSTLVSAVPQQDSTGLLQFKASSTAEQVLCDSCEAADLQNPADFDQCNFWGDPHYTETGNLGWPWPLRLPRAWRP